MVALTHNQNLTDSKTPFLNQANFNKSTGDIEEVQRENTSNKIVLKIFKLTLKFFRIIKMTHLDRYQNELMRQEWFLITMKIYVQDYPVLVR